MGILEINWIPILLVHIYLSPRFTQTDYLSLSQHRWPPYLSFPFLHTTPPDCWRYGLRHNGATCPVRYTCSVSQSLQWTHTHTRGNTSTHQIQINPLCLSSLSLCLIWRNEQTYEQTCSSYRHSPIMTCTTSPTLRFSHLLFNTSASKAKWKDTS